MKKIADTVSLLCANCSSGYRNGCPRGDWSKASVVEIPPVGTDKVCPIASMKATKRIEPILSEEDTWAICRKCQFTDDGEIAPDAYVMHCMDCPVEMAREGIQESAAEASVS